MVLICVEIFITADAMEIELSIEIEIAGQIRVSD